MSTGLSSDNYVVIQGFMCNELGLKGNDLLVFALIYGFSQDGKSVFNGGRKYIAETFNISLPTVDKALQNLVDMGIVIRESSNDYVHTDTYRALEGGKETLAGVVKKLYEGGKETLPNNIDNKLIDKKNNISTNVEIRQPKVDVSNHHSSKRTLITEPLVPKEKKKNLYEQCIDLIDEYTQDTDINEKLKEYLSVRLERKDKPFGAKTFGSILRKLDTLSQVKAVPPTVAEIVAVACASRALTTTLATVPSISEVASCK